MEENKTTIALLSSHTQLTWFSRDSVDEFHKLIRDATICNWNRAPLNNYIEMCQLRGKMLSTRFKSPVS